MTELDLLRALLLLAMTLAPLGTHRFLLPPTRWAAAGHALAVACVAVGLFASVPVLCGAWLVFCLASFGRFLQSRAAALRSPYELAGAVPFVFSIIAAVWLVGGSNGFHILGYGANFSYYAALHGNVVGWMMVGPLAVLARQDGPHRNLYLVAVVVSFGSFLLVAMGIDGHPAIKPIGVLGLSVALPVAQLAFVHRVWTTNKAAFALGCISLLGLVLTFVLAWQHELGLLSLPAVLGVRPMVSVHGLINGVVVAPCFLLAVALEAGDRAGGLAWRRGAAEAHNLAQL